MNGADIAGWNLLPGEGTCRYCGRRINLAQWHLGEDVYWVHSASRLRTCGLIATPEGRQ